MKSFYLNCLMAIFLLTIFSPDAFSQFKIDLEGSYLVSVPYNTVRIPGTSGTTFDVSKDLSRKTFFTYRLRGILTLGKRHDISILYAPLTVKSEGSINQNINYDNELFAAGIPLQATYKFNSYRLTYRFRIINNEKWIIALGVSGKIRDAKIALSNGNVFAEYPNVGFVPLVNFFVSWRFCKNTQLVLEGDALGASQGRAEDIFAGIYYDVSKHVSLKGGYRVLEGGANNEKVYNFTWINYASLGTLISF